MEARIDFKLNEAIQLFDSDPSTIPTVEVPAALQQCEEDPEALASLSLINSELNPVVDVVADLVAAMAMALAVWLVDQRLPVLDPVWRLAVLLAVGGVVYAGWMLAFARAALGELVAVLRKRPVTP